MRVECPFDVAERLVEDRTEHLPHERAADQAVAMLTGQCAAELEHEIGDVVRQRLERLHTGVGLQVHHRPDVQAADRRVGVDAGGRPMLADQREETRDVVAQPLGCHGRVLDERDRLCRLTHGHRQAECRLAQSPDTLLCRQIERVDVAVAVAARAEIGFERLEPRRQVVGLIGVEFDAEQRTRIAVDEGSPQAIEGRALLRVVEDEAVHDLDRRRPVGQDERRRFESFEQLPELDGQDCLRPRQRHQADLRGQDYRQRAFGADQHPRHVERDVGRRAGRAGRDG